MLTSVFIATSLDGYIARPDGDLDWLGEPPGEDAVDYGFREFMASVDVLVMGRNTFEKVLTFGDWPYGDKPLVVLSSRSLEIPARLPKTVESMSGDPTELVGRLRHRGAKHVYLDGGITIQRFLDAGLVQRLIIARIPVLIGSGIPLFGPLSQDVKLRHIETRSFPTGVVQSEYEIAPNSQRRGGGLA